MDSDILAITVTSRIDLVGENWLREDSPNYEPDPRLLENFDGQTGSQQPEIGDPGIGQKKGMKIAEFAAHHHLFAQDQREYSHHY